MTITLEELVAVAVAAAVVPLILLPVTRVLRVPFWPGYLLGVAVMIVVALLQ